MDFGSDRINQVCPAPDPVQRAPHRFTVPHGAVDSHAHVVGTTFVEIAATPRRRPAVGSTWGCSTPPG